MNNETEDKRSGSRGGLYSTEERIVTVRGECSQDYVLPDYMGDVKKVLKYSATIIPCNKFSSENEVSAMGIVTFRVLYLDADDLLTEASFSADYEHTECMRSDFSDASVDMKVQSVSIRLGGPRKISAKASVALDFGAVVEKEIPSLSDTDNCEIKKRSLKIHTAAYLKADEREYAEEIYRLEDTASDEVEIIKQEARAFIDAVYPTDSGVNLSGFAEAFCILRVNDEVMRLEKKIPIEEAIACEKTSPDVRYFPSAFVIGSTVNINNAADSDSDTFAVSVVMSMNVECGVTMRYNEEYSVVADAFMIGCPSDAEYCDFKYPELICALVDKAKLSYTYKREEEPIRTLYDWDAQVKNVSCKIDGADAEVTADLSITLVAGGDNADECCSKKTDEEIKLKYKLPAPCDNAKISLSVTPCEVSPSFDGEKIYVECCLSVKLFAEEEKSVRIIRSLKPCLSEAERKREIVVYCAEKGDTVWTVAKKYAIPTSSVIKGNPSLADCEEIKPGTKVIMVTA